MQLTPFLMCIMMTVSSINAESVEEGAQQIIAQKESVPKYLYKILSVDDWHKSQYQTYLQLSTDDSAFIHFSKEDQLSRICQKYWSHIPVYVVLKVETEKLVGDLVFEENQPGGAKYYHVYNGAIPLRSVIEATTIQQE